MKSGSASFKKSVFISHASKNFKLADELREALESVGVSCWIAPRDIPPGYQYGTAIVEALRDCTITLLLLTEEANQSKAVENEIERAFGYQKVIVPIRLREIKPATGLEFFISNAQWVDAIVSPLKSRVDQIVNIVHAIEMNNPVPAPAPEKRTLMGTLERFLEKTLRHKMISAISAFLILALIGGSGIYMQSRTHIDLTGIEHKIDKVKLETSTDPRKELANLGIPWDYKGWSDALDHNDVRVFSLFYDGGMFKDSESLKSLRKKLAWCFRPMNFEEKKPIIEFFKSRGLDYIKDFSPYTGKLDTNSAPLEYSLQGTSSAAFDWIIANNDHSSLQDYFPLLAPFESCRPIERGDNTFSGDIEEEKVYFEKMKKLIELGVRPQTYTFQAWGGNIQKNALEEAKKLGCSKYIKLFSK